jgi:hypothetical protein
MSALRAIQLMGAAAIGVLMGLACLNNLMDYNSNFPPDRSHHAWIETAPIAA